MTTELYKVWGAFREFLPSWLKVYWFIKQVTLPQPQIWTKNVRKICTEMVIKNSYGQVTFHGNCFEYIPTCLFFLQVLHDMKCNPECSHKTGVYSQGKPPTYTIDQQFKIRQVCQSIWQKPQNNIHVPEEKKKHGTGRTWSIQLGKRKEKEAKLTVWLGCRVWEWFIMTCWFINCHCDFVNVHLVLPFLIYSVECDSLL